MGGGSHLTQGIDHRGKNHIPQRGSKTLEHIGEGNFYAGSQNAHVWFQAHAFGRDQGVPPENPGDVDTAPHVGQGAGCRRAGDAPPGSGNGESEAQQGNGSGIIDQQEIQDDIDAVDNDPHPHGRLGVARGPEDGAEQD